MLNIPKDIKRKVFNALVNGEVIDGIQERDELENLVTRIDGIDLLKSEDPRYTTFIEDFRQHCLRNYDWTDEYLFVERLKVLESDNSFKSFVEAIVSPDLQESESDINKVVSMINQQLETAKASLSLFKYDSNGLPVYQLVERNEMVRQIRPSHKLQKFTFYVDKFPKGRSDFAISHSSPSPNERPCFILAHDRWNDFSVYSLFNLFWYPKEGVVTSVGAVKIIHKTELTEDQMERGNKYDTCDYIPESFQNLDGEIASLGQDQSYYNNLKSLFPNCYEDVLWALQDCAIFPIVEENFLEHLQFHSLIRNSKAEKLLREEKFLIQGRGAKERYHFSYEFVPKYSDAPLTLDFQFGQDGLFPHRLYALIGENGTGKTQFLSALPLDYAQKKLTCFRPHRPIFSRVMTVSMSVYDDIERPISDASFTYDFCGLRADEFCKDHSKTDVMLSHMLKSINEIEEHNRTKTVKEVLGNMLPESIINELFVVDNNRNLVFNPKSLKDILRKTSSGETCLLITFCDVMAKLRQDTLLLLDEPETHLHPRAVMNMMNTLYNLLEKFNSYAIVATHSALVIREVMAECVYKIKRVGDVPIVGRIKSESLGANLDELNEEIFGAMESGSYFNKLIVKMSNENTMAYEDIMATLKSDNIEPNLNLRILVKNLQNSKKL